MITAGEILKKKRESLKKSLNTVSVDTKIQKRFLEYIENDQYDKFDSEVFASGFIKIYSKYLGLDVEKLLAIYRRGNLSSKMKIEEKKNSKKITNRIKFHITPQILAITFLSIFLVLIIGYIGYQIYQYQRPPQLTILQPENEYKTHEEILLLKGNTQPSSVVVINGQQVEIDQLGYFEKKIILNSGVNTITVTSRKNSNEQLEVTKTLRVIYDEGEQEGEVVQPSLQEYKVVLQILQSASWIKLDIDGENKISQILEPNTKKEYIFQKEFTLVTGKVNSTSIEINGEKVEISAKQNTGVGQITCTVNGDSFKCI